MDTGSMVPRLDDSEGGAAAYCPDADVHKALADLARPDLAYGKLVAGASLVVVLAGMCVLLAVFGHISHAFVGAALGGLILACGVMFGEIYWRQVARLRMRALATAASALQAARLEAEASNRAQARFLATTTHEIRTPMNGVLGMLGLLLDTELTAEQCNYVTTAEASARSLLSIVDELLDNIRADHEPPTAGSDILDLVALVEGVTELLAPRAHAKGIGISCRVSRSVPQTLQANAQRLRQVLFNLCGNAIKFTEHGGVSVDADCPAADRLRICVSDTGIGMSSDELSRLFAEFTQASKETRIRFGGTGLGLSISKRLAEAMGGEIEAESQPGGGSRFTVTVPVAPGGERSTAQIALGGRRFAIFMPPGPTAAHIVATLREYGGEVDHMDQAEKLAALLGDPLAPASLWVIADAAYARELRSWAVQPAQARCGARVVVVMQSEERRQYRDLLGPPLAGYVLKPFRRGSLLRLITMVDPISGAVAELRQIAGRAAKQQGPRVLLAEDNPVNALLARTLLERAGCVVAHVLNGRQALEALAGAPRPDLIIMDVEMPGMDGLEATRRIRAREAESGAGRIPILALTANSRAEDHAQCLAAGMDGHLSKPFDRQDLDEAIGRLVPLRPAA